MLILIDCNEVGVFNALASGAKAAGATSMRWPPPSRTWPESDQFMLISDAHTPTLVQYAADLRARCIEPKRTLVRAQETPGTDWVYHDLPLFASISAPRTVEAATQSIQRLSRARAQRGDPGRRFPIDADTDATTPTYQLDEQAERLARLAAGNDLKVLLIGETGTGKNTFANHIHRLSGRTGEFVSVNCSALPETLIESELFGVEPGAYTGAQRSRPGKFEIADGGTLFIDEIDSLPLHLQAKLLGAIQDSGTTRLGDHKFRASRFRLITASQSPLSSQVKAGTFRADLMHRVSVVEIHLPAVRQLGSRLITTFESMLSSERARLGLPDEPIEPSLYTGLLSHDWPGNFRELAAAAQRCAVGLSLTTPVSAPQRYAGLREQLLDLERVLVKRALATREGNLRAASEDLKLPLETLRYRLRRLGLDEQSAGSVRIAKQTLEDS
jgi:transcriptional regulator with PAS, ATPase and Fis domain